MTGVFINKHLSDVNNLDADDVFHLVNDNVTYVLKNDARS